MALQFTREQLRSFPKAELHLHIEGTLEPDAMLQFAERNKVHLPYRSVEEIRSAYRFSNLQSFLDIYYLGASVLITERDFYDLTFSYLEKAHADGVVHSEIFFDPQAHTSRGVAFSTVINGMHRACQAATTTFGITTLLIMCFLRHLSEKDALETLQQALPFKSKIYAVGLDSGEKGNPPSKFQNVFKLARESGFSAVAHAGEEGPPESASHVRNVVLTCLRYIYEALDLLHVSRIDHGVRCTENEALMTRLASERIPLTTCPLSNVKLCVFTDLKHSNLKTLLHKGLCVTINADDPAYFGGYLLENLVQTQEALGISPSPSPCLLSLNVVRVLNISFIN